MDFSPFPQLKKGGYMRHLWIQMIGLFILLGLIACSEDDNESCAIIVQGIQGPIESGEILKSTSLNNHVYKFTFESESIEIPEKMVQSIDVDSAKWKTVLTLVDGNTFIIPSMGTSIDELIVNVTVNPSGYNPLAANITMNLPALGRMKIVVHSKPDSYTPNVEYLFNSIEKGQTITVIGLYPNYENQVDLIYTDKQGNERGRSLVKIKTKALEYLHLPKKCRVTKIDPSKIEPGMNLINSPGESGVDTSIPYMVDSDGEVRWLLDWNEHPYLNHISSHCGLSRLRNGNYITGDVNNQQLAEVDVLGNIIHRWDLKNLGYLFHHEVIEKADGKMLVAVTKSDAKIADGSNMRIFDHMIEFDPLNGQVNKMWDFATLLDSSRLIGGQEVPGSGLMVQDKSNWLHNNGVDECSDGSILCTTRWQGIFKYSYSGDLKWIIAPHCDWKNKYQKYLLMPLDKSGTPITDPDVLNGKKRHPDFDWFWGGHCPVELPNGNVLVFDNGFCRWYTSDHDINYSRAVEYKIDEKNMTIQQVWEYGYEMADYYAAAISGVDFLKQTGNYLFCPGMGNRLSNGSVGGRMVEIEPKTNTVVFELELESSYPMVFYRANRISLYPDNM